MSDVSKTFSRYVSVHPFQNYVLVHPCPNQVHKHSLSPTRYQLFSQTIYSLHFCPNYVHFAALLKIWIQPCPNQVSKAQIHSKYVSLASFKLCLFPSSLAPTTYLLFISLVVVKSMQEQVHVLQHSIFLFVEDGCCVC